MMLQAQNTNLPVGAIPGAIDVSPMGAATYTIPIEVVPGTQGMQPNLSIVYNSMSGMGLLGMKWNLAGVSAIKRCGQTIYHDGKITAVQFDANDRFMLDEERLILVNDNIYATEVENFMRVVLYGPTGNPTHFIAYTDDGTIIEYGNTNNSKQMMTYPDTDILSWQINKITDFNGNEMNFIYYNSGDDNEICINEIRYGNFLNSFKVTFNYKLLPEFLGKNTYYVKGYPISQTKIFTNIIISYNNTQVRKYEFKYRSDNPFNVERSVHLEEVTLFGKDDNEQLGSTIISWRDQTTPTPSTIAISNANIVTGDFNGDGYMDYVNYNRTTSENKWQLYLGNTNGNLFTAVFSTEKSHLKNCYFYSADINGDGCDELIIAEQSPVTSAHYIIRILSLKTGEAIQIGDSYMIENFHQIHFGDFNGDGKTDILFGKWGYNIQSWKYNYSFEMYNSISGFTTLELNKDNICQNCYPRCKVLVGDFNGNGKTDVELRFANGLLKRYYLSGNDFYPYTISPQLTADTVSARYSGDFNGDGVTDLLTFYSNWKISFGTGDGGYTTPVIINDLRNDLEVSTKYGIPKFKIAIADFDGDGKDDIIQFTPVQAKILYSKGFVSQGVINQYRYKTQDVIMNLSTNTTFHIADMNNDGLLDIISKGSLISNPNTIYLINKERQYDFPEKITDGMGKTIKLFFIPKYLPANEFNTSQSITKKYFHFLLDNFQISNGLGEFNSFQYQYYFPVLSAQRKTFLGFKEFVCTNQAEKKKDLYKFSENRIWHIMIPESQTTYYNNLKESETVHNLSILSFSNREPLHSGRYLLFPNGATIIDKLHDSKTIFTSSLDVTTGRLLENNTLIYNTGNANSNNWFHSETKTYTYDTIVFNNAHKKTVITQVLTTQQYKNNNNTLSPLITDTLTYNYYRAGKDKGRLNWQRQGNIDGVITTTYDEYRTTGVYGKKIVSATDCESRTEEYIYDNTHRFVAKITHPDFADFETNFTYDAKTGNKLSETDINGLKTNYTYDTFGNLTKIVYPDGTQTSVHVDWWTSNAIPNALYYTKTTSSGKPTVEIYYDVLGREVCRKDDNIFYDTRYYANGQVEKTSYPYTKLSEPDGSKDWCKYTYDDYGRKNTETAPYTDLSYQYNNRKVTVTDNLRHISSWKDYDALGRIIGAVDAGGLIAYNYSVITASNKPRHQTTITTNNATTTIESDLWGNRLSIEEPNAEAITSTYNKFNELVEQTDARGNITTYEYDKLGRITLKQFIAPYIKPGPRPVPYPITYTYDNYSTTNRGRGKLHTIQINGSDSEVFTYDALSRLAEHNKLIDNLSHKFNYTYNTNGQLHTLTYPDNFTVNYSYSSVGKLTEIKNGSNNLIYKISLRNKYNAPTLCSFGNNLATDYRYNDYGWITEIISGNKIYYKIFEREPGKGDPPMEMEINYIVDGSILNYHYAYNEQTGLMASRTDYLKTCSELFYYDNLDRLTQVAVETLGQPGALQTFSYHNNGNMEANSEVGDYIYGGNKPHAVTQIMPIDNTVISENQCDVTYNFFNQPTQITEGDYRLELFYDANQQRNKMTRYRNDTLENTRYYISKHYEKEIDHTTGITRHYNYIYGENDVVALSIFNETTGADSIYYIHTDHLGSYCVITSPSKNVAQSNQFDAWGNPLSLTGLTGFTLTNRGFTGHEHYPDLKIINMNGRLYDPVIAPFSCFPHFFCNTHIID